jgi:hypothetical protein
MCHGSKRTTGDYRLYPCDKAGKPEPPIRDKWDYNARVIIQVPNVEHESGENLRNLEGQTYCGIHSPAKRASKKAAEEAKLNERRLTHQDSAKKRVARYATIRARIVDALAGDPELLEIFKEVEQFNRDGWNIRQ